MDLVEILKNPEDKTLKFERDRTSPAGAPRPVVAFTNAAGESLLVFHTLVHEVGPWLQALRRRNVPPGHTPS